MGDITEEDENENETTDLFGNMHRAGLDDIDMSVPLQIFNGLYQRVL